MGKVVLRKFVMALLSTCFLAFTLSAAHAGAITELISVNAEGVATNGSSVVESGKAVSADGNIVVFSSVGNDLDPTASGWALYRRDRAAAVTEMISDNTGGISGNPEVSADGMLTTFTSGSAIWVHDYAAGVDEMISVNLDGVAGNNCGTCGWPDNCNGCEYSNANTSPSISADGRYVAFASFSSDLVDGDVPLTVDVFVRDRFAGTTEIISVAGDGTYVGGAQPSISADGRYVAFVSASDNLVAGDTNGYNDVFIHDRVAGTTDIVSTASDGTVGNLGAVEPAISGDGTLVAFTSGSTNLVRRDGNGTYYDVFVKDVASGDVISLTSKLAAGGSTPSISEDGNWVTYESANKMYLVSSRGSNAQPLNIDNNGNEIYGMSFNASLNADGSVVAFSGYAPLVPEDTNSDKDVYVRDMNGSSGTEPPSTCSDFTAQDACEANGCRWNKKKQTCS